MPVLNGIDAARQLRKIVPSAKLIFLTMHGDADYVTEAFRAGASGYLLKRSAASELITAIREVLKGHHYVSPLVTRNALELLISGSKAESKFAEGRTRKEIADTLNISVKTVEFHKATLSRELNLRTPADFTLYAIEHGIIASERTS